MSTQMKFTQEEVKHLSFRIKSCRALTGMTQEEFGKACGFPLPSIKTWEFGGVVPKVEGLKRFCDALQNFGIFVTTEWLFHGFGTGPTYYLKQPEKPVDLQFGSELAILKQNFENSRRKSKENSIFFEVNDDEMAPLFARGDVIGGILQGKSDFQNIHQKPVVARFEDGITQVRFVCRAEDDFFISSIQNPIIQKVKLDAIGIIKLHYSV